MDDLRPGPEHALELGGHAERESVRPRDPAAPVAPAAGASSWGDAGVQDWLLERQADTVPVDWPSASRLFHWGDPQPLVVACPFDEAKA